MVPDFLLSQVQPLHSMTRSPSLVCLAFSLCVLVPRPVRCLHFFSRWSLPGIFFFTTSTPTCHIFSLSEVLFFKVCSIPLLHTSLLGTTFCHHLTSMLVPFLLTSITWHFDCILPEGLTQSPT